MSCVKCWRNSKRNERSGNWHHQHLHRLAHLLGHQRDPEVSAAVTTDRLETSIAIATGTEGMTDIVLHVMSESKVIWSDNGCSLTLLPIATGGEIGNDHGHQGGGTEQLTIYLVFGLDILRLSILKGVLSLLFCL